MSLPTKQHFLRAGCVVAAIASLALAGCQSVNYSKDLSTGSVVGKAETDGWTIVDEQTFTMEVPDDMKRKKLEAHDARAGIYRSSTMELRFEVKDALVFDGRRARTMIAQLHAQYKAGVQIPVGGQGVVIIGNRYAYLRSDRSDQAIKAGLPFINSIQVMVPGPSGGSHSILVVYKEPSQAQEAMKVINSIKFK